VLVVFSTSGNSKNCIEAIKAAHAKDMKVFGFLWKWWG
jgi:phosphoheptose isomerase